jgi:hypothetical protein
MRIARHRKTDPPPIEVYIREMVYNKETKKVEFKKSKSWTLYDTSLDYVCSVVNDVFEKKEKEG